MDICVCLKQTADTASQIKLQAEGQGIDESGLEWIINPYDEFALEMALQIAETLQPSDQSAKVHIISIGPQRAQTALRRGLAMGADHAYLVECLESERSHLSDPLFVSEAIALTTRKFFPDQAPDLILTGKLGVDENHSATGVMLAEHLNLQHIGFVNKLKKIHLKQIIVERTMSDIIEEITTDLPVLLTVDKGTREPRYPTLPGIIQAKKKPLTTIKLSDLKLSSPATIRFSDYQKPSKSPKAHILSGTPEEQAKELVKLLKENEKLL